MVISGLLSFFNSIKFEIATTIVLSSIGAIMGFVMTMGLNWIKAKITRPKTPKE
jgi:hypothetical protein